jgi:hypothetical protein
MSASKGIAPPLQKLTGRTWTFEDGDMVFVAKTDPLTIVDRIHDDTEVVEGYVVSRIIWNTGHDVATISSHCTAECREGQYKEHRKDDENHCKAGMQTTSFAKVADNARYPKDKRLVLEEHCAICVERDWLHLHRGCYISRDSLPRDVSKETLATTTDSLEVVSR